MLASSKEKERHPLLGTGTNIFFEARAPPSRARARGFLLQAAAQQYIYMYSSSLRKDKNDKEKACSENVALIELVFTLCYSMLLYVTPS